MNKIATIILVLSLLFIYSCSAKVETKHIKWAQEVCKDNGGINSIMVTPVNILNQYVVTCNNTAVFEYKSLRKYMRNNH